ncbi:MAG TPA: acyl-CoA carboxylase epsilon subunit [Pseudonocardia sp.]|nr:acyl-CoA carboxylase epsilon subunit [Pseudonocardia sp.]
MSGRDEQEAEPTPGERRALFRVVRGGPRDEELAALTAVLAAASAAGSAAPEESGPRSVWNEPRARLRTPLPVGPDVWRTSYWPR